MKMYHSTLDTGGQAESIEKTGLRTGTGIGFTLQGSWADKIYGTRPIYLSVKPGFGGGRSYEGIPFEVDVTGLDLVTDLPTLADYGAYVEEDGMYWEDGEVPPEMKEVVDGDGFVLFDDLLQPNSPAATAAFTLTDTAVSLEDIPPDRVSRLATEGLIRGYVQSLLESVDLTGYELDNQNSYFEEWHEKVIEELTKDGYDPVKHEKGARRSYTDGYTVMEFSEEWLTRMGLL